MKILTTLLPLCCAAFIALLSTSCASKTEQTAARGPVTYGPNGKPVSYSPSGAPISTGRNFNSSGTTCGPAG